MSTYTSPDDGKIRAAYLLRFTRPKQILHLISELRGMYNASFPFSAPMGEDGLVASTAWPEGQEVGLALFLFADIEPWGGEWHRDIENKSYRKAK